MVFPLGMEDDVRISPSLALALVLFSAILPPAHLLGQDPAKVTLEGKVLDAVSGRPLEGVTVMVSDLGLRVVSDLDGAFVLAGVPLGPHQLTIQKEGYEELAGRLRVDQGGEMVFRMRPLGGPDATELSLIRGRVRDIDGGGLLGGATVSLRQLGLVQITDSDGAFLFEEVPEGQYTIAVELLGYSTREESVAVRAGKRISLALALAVQPIELEPIEVSVEARNFDLEMTGFYQRREASSGIFITREKILERAPLFTTDIFQGLAGVRVVGGLGMGTQKAVVVSGSRALSFSSEPGLCYPAVWLDGQLVHSGSAGSMVDGPAFLEQLVNPDMLAGVEIFSGAARIPVQFNVYSACGVIVLWTRQGR